MGVSQVQFFIILLFVGVFYSIIRLIFVYFSGKRAEKRSKELEELSKELYGSFGKYNDDDFLDQYHHFHLFSKGPLKFVHNMISAKIDNEISMRIFDYTSSGFGHSRTFFHSQTAIMFSFKTDEFPSFLLYNNSMVHDYIGNDLKSLFSNPQITFKHPTYFHHRFKLRGRNEVAIRKIFTDDIFEVIKSEMDFSIQCVDNRVLIYRHHKSYSGEALKDFMRECIKIVEYLVRNEECHNPLDRTRL